MKKWILLFILILNMLFFACTKEKQEDFLSKDFKEIEKSATSSTVRFYMWGGSATINKWVDEVAGQKLKEKYNITLERVPMDASIFVNKLITEKVAGKESGTIDLIWINGENFKNAMEAKVLYGPFLKNLPSYQYVNPSSVEYDFGYPVNGYESPYGRAHFVFEYNTARIKTPPNNIEELKKWVKNNPGRFTYPQPPDFTGSAFVRQLFYATTGGHQQYMNGLDKALFEKNAPKLWAYLNEIKPYLWQKGQAYPKDSAMLDTLFARGEIDLGMSYYPTHAANQIKQGIFPKTIKSFLMNEGSMFNTHFVAIPFNAPNKAGALVMAEFLLSPEMQYSKNMPDNWGDYTALDINKLSPEMKSKFDSLDLGKATLPFKILAEKAVPEIPSAYLELLEKGWEKNILH